MKKLSLVLYLLLNTCFLFAQTAVLPARIVDGAVMRPANDVIQNADSAKELSTFVIAIQASGLISNLKAGPVTIFAPTNQAFMNLPAGVLDSLLKPAHLQELKNLVLYHAVAGSISAKDIARQIQTGNGQAILTTLAGGKLIASIDTNRNIVLTDAKGGKSIISRFDILQSNGILDIVTAVLMPSN
jgi:uncharacterized surface protein with fasciclin (FAS1) repeats